MIVFVMTDSDFNIDDVNWIKINLIKALYILIF